MSLRRNQLWWSGLPALVLCTSVVAAAFDWGLLAWVPEPVVPADNPMSHAKVELGRHLFYDPRLSANGQMACATCHHQDKAFTDGLARSPGVTGESAPRNAQSLANVAYMPVLTWANPLLTDLEIQALIPLFGEHPVEMGMAGREQELFDRLANDATYRHLFQQAFAEEARQGPASLYSLSTLTKALAAFQRSLVSFNSPYDRYRYGNQPNAISPAAKRGEELFFSERMECYHCHGGFLFSDNIKHRRLPFPELGFHHTGLYNTDGRGGYPKGHEGLQEITGHTDDHGLFRTPSLRNVAVTAPYMHDGSIATLYDVIRNHYAVAGRAAIQGQGPSPLRSAFIEGFGVTDEEIKDLVAFLESLTDTEFLQNPRHGNPWASKP
jgi:cytochrome c peroxidase